MRNSFSLILIFVLAKLIMGQEEMLDSNVSKLSLMRMRYYESTTLNNEILYWLEEMKRQIKRERQRIDELKKMYEEEKRRRIINEKLMPLTKGNSFMRDFYTERY